MRRFASPGLCVNGNANMAPRRSVWHVVDDDHICLYVVYMYVTLEWTKLWMIPVRSPIKSHYYPTYARRKSGIKKFVHFCLSVYKRQFIIEEQLDFNGMLYFEHESEHEPGSLALDSSRFHMCRGECDSFFILSACLAIIQNLKSFQAKNVLFLRMS